MIDLRCGDNREVLRAVADCSVDAVVCDPPYELGFMGRQWDASGIAYDVGLWREVLRVLRPGGHLVAFGGTRTYHRMTCAIEDAGFDIRDCLGWLYGSGFPKSLDVSKAIDKQRYDLADIYRMTAWVRAARDAAGISNRDIDDAFGFSGMAGHWTSAKSQPAAPTLDQVPTLLNVLGVAVEDVPKDIRRLLWDLNGRKGQPSENWWKREVVGQRQSSLGGTVAAGERDADFIAEHRDKMFNITAPATDAAKQWSGWGTALKPAWEPAVLARKPLVGTVAGNVLAHGCGALNVDGCRVVTDDDLDRWPANILHDDSDEVRAVFPDDASRFFYSAKAAAWEREAGLEALPRHTAADLVHRTADSAGMDNPRAGAGRTSQGRANTHPTVKPIDLMRWLCRLVTPPGGTVLDPFAGSGSTGVAAVLEGFGFRGIELDPHHVEIARERIAAAADRRLTVQNGKVSASNVPDAQMRLL